MGEKDGTRGSGSQKADGRDDAKETGRVSALLRLPDGDGVDLTSYDARDTPAWRDGKAAGLAATRDMRQGLADLQERLWAASTAGDRRRVLLILQGMDTSGKGGTVKHVVGMFNPAGCRIRAFKAPTPEERKHSFLWRIRRALPEAGEIGIFDRSHYEDVLVARVRGLAPHKEIARRYREINRFEESLADEGVTVVKCFLHISYDQQRRRLLRRLDNPAKHWKFSAGDIEDRALWPEYRKAYEIALDRCSTPRAPWFVVPADRKWYRNWAIGTLLLEHLEALDPRYPKADFDVTEYRKQLLKSV
ncbi:PPK2 family polyphosphate kinase [Streptomyces sp. NPDC048448]|uniref:PPK2 family polyphosphate kinase n=1 Tax=unclassified Streptomyces TaxID=2593676 RepID=UPI00143ED119|nr:polyphosphate kinase 2 family protein [Streptomyces sp. RPA4-2]